MNEKNLKENGILIRPFNLDDIDFVISGQLELYELEYGFKSDIWKSYVIDGVHDLVDQFDSKKDCMYILEHDGLPMGCAAITHVDDITAKFRFFFVDPKLRGKGAGHKLLDMSVKFCVDNGYKHVYLWTFSTLYAARHLYERVGFKIIDTRENNEWGNPILEELWEMEL